MQRKRKLGRGVAVVGAGMSKFGMFKDKNSKDLFAEAFNEMRSSVDKGVDPEDIEALYVGNFTNDFFVHQGHWGPVLSDLIGHAPKPATRTEGACASGALAFREGVFAIASGFYDVVLVGGPVGDAIDTQAVGARCPDPRARAGRGGAGVAHRAGEVLEMDRRESGVPGARGPQ